MTETKKAMLCQPVGGKTDEEIKSVRGNAVAVLESMGYEVVDSFFTQDLTDPFVVGDLRIVNEPLCYLGMSLAVMSLCHVVYFCKGWEGARGCRVEHETAFAYGLTIMYED